ENILEEMLAKVKVQWADAEFVVNGYKDSKVVEYVRIFEPHRQIYLQNSHEFDAMLLWDADLSLRELFLPSPTSCLRQLHSLLPQVRA
ncbi:hypothetical protein T492DRAFT_868483, partial [Pavlovales sp. CCMP2436]